MNRLNYSGLWAIIFVSLALMLVFSLGGGVWGAGQSIGHWTGTLFQNVCHQNPARSFTFNGAPMAVNSRCFGVFAGLLAGWMLIPVCIRLNIKKYWPVRLLLFAVIVQIIDYSGNLFQFWENTNTSRAVLGFILGVSASTAVFDLFKSEKNK